MAAYGTSSTRPIIDSSLRHTATRWHTAKQRGDDVRQAEGSKLPISRYRPIVRSLKCSSCRNRLYEGDQRHTERRNDEMQTPGEVWERRQWEARGNGIDQCYAVVLQVP
jgi:hypothetical protein